MQKLCDEILWHLDYKIFDKFLTRCLGVEEVGKVCGTTKSVNLYRRLQRQGYYWLNMARDAKAQEEVWLKRTWMPDRAECAFINVVD